MQLCGVELWFFKKTTNKNTLLYSGTKQKPQVIFFSWSTLLSGKRGGVRGEGQRWRGSGTQRLGGSVVWRRLPRPAEDPDFLEEGRVSSCMLKMVLYCNQLFN